MNMKEIQAILREIKYPEYDIYAEIDGRGEMYLQASYREADIHTGEVELQRTRRWFISPEMKKSELVQTAFKCIITSAEHRVREHFRYKGELVFGPHFDVEKLVELCRTRRASEYRDTNEEATARSAA